MAEDAVGLDAAEYVLDLGAALEDALGLQAVLLGEGLLLGDVDDGHEGRKAGLLGALDAVEDGLPEDVEGLHAVHDPHEVDVLGEVDALLRRDLRRRVDEIVPRFRVRVRVRVRLRLSPNPNLGCEG